jgi:hypothetical protein
VDEAARVNLQVAGELLKVLKVGRQAGQILDLCAMELVDYSAAWKM